MDQPKLPDADPARDRALLTQLAVAMVATGQPVYEIDEDLIEVGRHLGHPAIQVATSPTGVMLALGSGQPATMETISGPLRLDQSAEVRWIRHQLLTGKLNAHQAMARLTALRDQPERYPKWLSEFAWVIISVGIGLILQPGIANLVLTAICSALVLGLARLSGRSRGLTVLLPTVAAFVVGCLVFGAAAAGLVDGALRTLLPPLAILLPGATLVTGLSEIAAGAMVAGVSRLGYGTVQLLLFALGVLAAAGLLGVPAARLNNIRVDELGWWAVPVGLLLICAGLCLNEGIRLSFMPWVVLVLAAAFGAQVLGQQLSGASLGGFLGGLAASFAASAVALLGPQLPRLVLFLPAFWMLVPGSLGLLSVTELALGPGSPSTAGFGVIELIGAIALGLLVGSVLARSLQAVLPRPKPVDPR
ncbi:MAG: threonine/serine exporter family protein [Microlunatus sp.]